MQKKVSIITPSFNRADIIHETAVSIFNQIYTNWEWMIVDDGSTDNSWEVLQGFAKKDERVKISKRDREPKGACVCRNIGIKKSTGDYLIFLDTDDLLASFCLDQRVKAMEEVQDCDFLIFPMLLFKQKPDDLKMLWNIENGEDDLVRIMKGNPICQGTGTLWKKSSFVKIGMWKEDLKLWQDIELHIRSLLWPMKFKKRMDLKPDVFLRVSEVSLSRTGYNTLPKLKSRISVCMDAFETIKNKNLLEKYNSGLRHMGWEIALGAVNSSNFNEAKSFINFLNNSGLFKKEEIRKIDTYCKIRQYKIYKITQLNTYYFNKAYSVVPKPTYTIGNISWEQPVVI